MPLAWNEIRHRAIKFANDNARAVSEAGEKQTFWNEFFEVFGIARKTVASFKAPGKKTHRTGWSDRSFLGGGATHRRVQSLRLSCGRMPAPVLSASTMPPNVNGKIN